jgi:hypothetical protein
MPSRVVKVTVADVAFAVLASGCDWAMFRGNAAHAGFNSGETAVGVGNVATPQEKWTGATGEDVLSSPAVSSGRVFVGSNDNQLHAYGLP